MRPATIVLMFCVLAIIACNRANNEPPATNSGQKTASQQAPAGPKAQTACQLLTAGEIAGFLKVPAVQKDEINSGRNEMTKVDFCNWYVSKNSNEGVELRLRRADSVDEGSAMLVFSAAKGDAVEHDAERSQKAEPLSGVGDEAIYSPYPVGKGGNVAFRVGSSAVTITASVSKDVLISMAQLAARRL